MKSEGLRLAEIVNETSVEIEHASRTERDSGSVGATELGCRPAAEFFEFTIKHR
jgi:hypothetical protein